MKPILIHGHIFHVQFWDELKECIKKVMQYPSDLYVTIVGNHEDIQADIIRNFPKANVRIIESRGFDVGPFVEVLGQVDLDKYSYIVKLHTKRDLAKDEMGFRCMHSDIWRNNLLLPFRNEEIFRQYIENFEQHPYVGMTACYQLFVKNSVDSNFDKNSYDSFKSFLHKSHLKNISFQYVAGTMFIARANLFKYIQKMGLSLKDFPISNRMDKGDLAHVLERFFGYSVYAQGFILRDLIVPRRKEISFQSRERIKYIWPWLSRFFFQKKVTRSRNLIIKICKIHVYRRKV